MSSAPGSFAPFVPLEPARDDAELARRLRCWGDPRVELRDGGVDGYHCASRPAPEVLELGSCTASTVSAAGWLAARETDRRISGEGLELFASEVKQFLFSYFALPEGSQVILTPSATDAEFLVSLLAFSHAQRPVTIVMPAENERGGGSALAAALRHFAHRTPSGASVEVGSTLMPSLRTQVNLVSVAAYDDSGAPLPADEIEDAMDATIVRAVGAGHAVLVHALDHGKTGFRAPRQEAIAHWRASFPERVRVAIDAAQGRCSAASVGRAVAAGALVVISGSKFYGGPPFAGALLVPSEFQPPLLPTNEALALGTYLYPAGLPLSWQALRRSLSATAREPEHVGPLLRWSAALVEMTRFRSVPTPVAREIIAAFAQSVAHAFAPLELLPSARSDSGGDDPLATLPTVFSFALGGEGKRLGIAALKRVAARLLASRARAHLGQPAALGGGNVALRVALGAPLLCDLADVWTEERRRASALGKLRSRLERVVAVLVEEASLAEETDA